MISLQDALNFNNKAVALYHSNDIPEAAKAYYESRQGIVEVSSSDARKHEQCPYHDCHNHSASA
jgi:hypothetical protein